MYESQILSQTHPWLWHAVCEARPTGGDGPDAGGSAFFDRTKNEPIPVKNSAIPAGRWRRREDCLFLWYFLLGKQKKVQMPGKSDQPGQKGTYLRLVQFFTPSLSGHLHAA
jgi:hypothetical protein